MMIDMSTNKKLTAIIVVALCMASPVVTAEGGKTLYLIRGASQTVTKRAEFIYAADCELIAKRMNEVEKARWFCK
jgi:hypothetical protein